MYYYKIPCIVVSALNRLSLSCFVPKILAVKVAAKLRSRFVSVVLGPSICRVQEIPRILDMRFQIAVTSEHVADFG